MPAGLPPAASFPPFTRTRSHLGAGFVYGNTVKQKSLSNSSEERDVFSYSVTLKL